MPAELISLTDISPAERDAWRELADRSVEPNPFFDPDYVLALADGLGARGEVALAVARAQSGWLACLPVSTERWHRIPLGSISTWRGHVLYGLLGTPLLAELEPGPISELVALLRGHSGSSFAALEWLAADGEAAGGLEAAGSEGRDVIEFESFERAFLRRRPEDTYLTETLGSKRRRELRRQRRKLGEELGAEVELVVGSEERAIEELLRLESAGAKGERGTVLRADAGHERFFREMCRGFAERGALQVLELRAGERTLAVKCNLRAGDGLFMLKIAYDEEVASFSPGILLEEDMLKVFHELPNADFMDSCADPNNAMINRLWPDRRRITSLVLPADGPRGRLAGPAIRAARELRERNRERKS